MYEAANFSYWPSRGGAVGSLSKFFKSTEKSEDDGGKANETVWLRNLRSGT